MYGESWINYQVQVKELLKIRSRNGDKLLVVTGEVFIITMEVQCDKKD